MINIKNIKKTYYIDNKSYPVLHGITLNIEKNDIYGIIGRSGAGKSTLMRCINFLEIPTDGDIIINNINLATLESKDLKLMRQNIGMIFQHFNLLKSKDVFHNISLPLEIRKVSKKEIKIIVNKLLTLVNLTTHKNSYPEQLSGGQKQRVAIARALVNKPDFLLSDEATSALDPEATEQILQLLKKINKEMNVTIIIITHEMEVVREICNKVAILEDGKVAEKGCVLEVFSNPQTAIAKTLTEKTMSLTLPEQIIKNMVKNPYEIKFPCPILKMSFIESDINDPVLSIISKEFHLTINIILANIQPINSQAIGICICQMQGEQSNWERALKQLTNKKINIEILGYTNLDKC